MYANNTVKEKSSELVTNKLKIKEKKFNNYININIKFTFTHADYILPKSIRIIYKL